MGSTTQDIVIGLAGQQLHVDVPDGRPLSVTSVMVWRNDEAETTAPELATSGAPSIEANPNTTLDAPSGVSQADQRLISLTATTGMAVGRSYLMKSQEGESEWIEVASIVAGATVRSKHDLENDYDAGATFQTTRLQIAMDLSWIGSDSSRCSWELEPNPRYRVRWTYVASDGLSAVIDTYFDVVRYAARYSVTGLDVDNLQPGWLDRLARDDREEQGRSAIESAYQAVKWDLYGDLLPDQAIRNRELFERLITARAAADVVPSQVNVDRYTKLYAQLIRSGVTPVATNDEGARRVPVRPIWRR